MAAVTSTDCGHATGAFHKSLDNEQKVKELGISTSKPKFPEYAFVDRREESFRMDEWPSSCPVAVKDLVEAGLVYTGVGDSVRCYHCGGGIRNWEKDDDPIEEHAKYYPNCGHVLLVKGRKYVDDVIQGQVHRSTKAASNVDSRTHIDVEYSEDKQTFAFKTMLEMGYKEEDVKIAVRIFKHDHEGRCEYLATDLCEILMDLEDNPALRRQFAEKNDLDIGGTDEQDESQLTFLQEENRILRNRHECKICLDRMADIIFLPCGHIASCGQCASVLAECPICRSRVHGTVKAFYATTTNHFYKDPS